MVKRVLKSFAFLLTAGFLCAGQNQAGEKEVTCKQLEKGMTAPVLIEKTAPTYPKEAKEEKVEGAVKLDIVIGTEGQIVEVKAVASPDKRLSTSAVDSVKQWKFTPAKDKEGKPVQCKASVTVNFKLK